MHWMADAYPFIVIHILVRIAVAVAVASISRWWRGEPAELSAGSQGGCTIVIVIR